MKINTYNHGYKLNVVHPLTKDDIVVICHELEAAFGPGHEFRPEPIGQGFLLWSSWPGKDKEGYKCMRLSCMAARHNFNWPWINPNVMEEWDGNPDVVIPVGRYSTFLKSFRTAPKWTQAELKKIKECLTRHHVRVGAIPAQKKLDDV